MTATSFNQAQAFGSQQFEEINNPATGDHMMILQSSQTNQGYAKIQFNLPPGAKGSPLHYHTRMSETFTVVEGELEMEVGGKKIGAS